MNIQLRPWQSEAITKALSWLLDPAGGKRFLINAAPGAGKTLCASAIAQQLLSKGEIDRVIVIAPRAEVVNQWADDFRRVTGRFMTKVTGRDQDVASMGLDVCATWAAVQGLQDALQAVCQAQRTLVICDEHHHAAVEAAWGDSADSAFHAARFVLVLTGTPIRSDGSQSVWLAYDDHGAITHPEAGTFTLTYGQAVDLAYCRPVTFHRHQARFTVDLKDGNVLQVAGDRPADLPADLKRIGGLQRALDFYRLACTPQFEKDGVTPLATGYQATMAAWAGAKLDELRNRMPDAGGLVIAPSIEMAEYMVEVIEKIEGERPVLVHSQLPNAESRIRAFRNTDKRWLVSVAMVSEGVDIPRLRLLVYLPSALTELAFRQAIGRVVRTAGPSDDTRAYVVMPAFDTFEHYARRVEEEMPHSTRGGSSQPRTKKCPQCHSESPLGAASCECCGFEFPRAATRFKACVHCGALNPVTAGACQNCGQQFATGFVLTLDEALRTGAIVRGLDIDEQAVQQSEAMATAVRQMVLKSGDARLVRVLSTLPEESWSRLRDILAAGQGVAEHVTH
jgi:superfamily II DNA or RNA helicase